MLLKCPTAHKTAPTERNDLTQNVCGAEAECYHGTITNVSRIRRVTITVSHSDCVPDGVLRAVVLLTSLGGAACH